MFIRFQYILTCWHGSLIRNPLEVTSAFTLFVASLFSSLLFFSTCGASSAVFFGPMQPVPLSDFSALLPNGHICIIDCDIRIMETASGCSRLYVGT